jgi:hypothetical protein
MLEVADRLADALYLDAPAVPSVVVAVVGVEGHHDVGDGSAQTRVGGDTEHDVVAGEGVSHGADGGQGCHAERDAPDRDLGQEDSAGDRVEFHDRWPLAHAITVTVRGLGGQGRKTSLDTRDPAGYFRSPLAGGCHHDP